MWILLLTQFCLWFLIKVSVVKSECCLTQSSGRKYCQDYEYCCQMDGWPDGSNLYCCSSIWDRAQSIYIDPDISCRHSPPFPTWGIILIVFGLFFIIVTSITIYCCVRKSRGFRGTVNSTAPVAAISPGVTGTAYPCPPPPYTTTAGYLDTPPYDRPPPYPTLVSTDNTHR